MKHSVSSIKNLGEALQTKKGTTDITAANEKLIADGTLGNRLQLDSFIIKPFTTGQHYQVL